MRIYTWLVFLCGILGGTVLVSKLLSSNDELPPVPLNEEYDVNLYRKIHSVSDLLAYVDSTAGIKDKRSLAYAEALSSTIRKRFFHNYSFYSLSENWGAALAGKFIWLDLGAIVVADDMLKHPMAACSQQSLILLTCFERLGVPYRAVRFAHHFAAEGMFSGKWFYFDTDKEPQFPNGRKSVDELLKSGEFYTAYAATASTPGGMEWWIGTKQGYPLYDSVSVMPAPRARLFQHVTKWGSDFGFLILALILLIRTRYADSKTEFGTLQQNNWLWKKKPAVEMS